MKTLTLVLIILLTAACGKAPSPTETKIKSCAEKTGAEFWTLQGFNECGAKSGEYCLHRENNKLYANDKEVDPSTCEYKMFNRML
jgi:hypothetical protein